MQQLAQDTSGFAIRAASTQTSASSVRPRQVQPPLNCAVPMPAFEQHGVHSSMFAAAAQMTLSLGSGKSAQVHFPWLMKLWSPKSYCWQQLMQAAIVALVSRILAQLV